jgi:hypothetical protein
MVALLLSFGFDLKVENTEKQTPLQLADSLKFSCLNEGWKIYFDLTSLKIVLPVIIQSMRQNKSTFNKIPFVCSELIVSFLSQKTPALKETVVSSQNYLSRISAGCVVKAFPGMFRRHSSESREFIAELKTALATHGNLGNIGSPVSTFLKKNNGKKTRTLGLLFKYHLVREVNGEVVSCAPSVELKK